MDMYKGALRVLQRLITLMRTFDRRRFNIACNLLCRGELRILVHQLSEHTAFRSQLNRVGADRVTADSRLSVHEPIGLQKSYVESAWPDDHPLVSVIISCFHDSGFIAGAVDSVLAQTFQDLEIIVIEGGSTDAVARDAIAALCRPKMRVLFGSARRPGDNRNFAIAQARGKYICCLSVDDRLQPTYLEKAVFLLENYGYDIVPASARTFGARDGGYDVVPGLKLFDMLKGNHVTACALVRRSLWREASSYRDEASGIPFVLKDWGFWMRLAAFSAQIVNIAGERLFWYRARDHHGLGSRSLPNRPRSRLIQAANQDVMTSEVAERSRPRVAKCLRSSEVSRNLLRHARTSAAGPTILLAVPHLVLGGAERLLSQLVCRMGKSGYRIVIVTTLPALPQLGDTTSWFEGATSEIYQLPCSLAPSRWFDFIDYLIRAKGVEILWIAGSAFFYDALPRLEERHGDLRVVDHLFNTIAHTYDNRRMARLIHLTIVESEATRAWLLSEGRSDDRIRLIPSGIDLHHYRPDYRPGAQTASVVPEKNHAGDPFIVGYSGRLAEEKAPMSFVKIAESIPAKASIRFIMTGAGLLEDDVREAIRCKGLEERLHFAGAVADIRDYLAFYDVLILPSKVDGRPTVVMEALAMGVPVIASRVGALADLVIHGETGFLCDPADTRAFIDRIEWLHCHRREHAKMRLAARRFGETHFSLERMEKAYSRVFTDLLAIR